MTVLVDQRSTRVRPGLRAPGPPTFGTWVKLPTLETLELLAHAGFEFVVIDLEHSPLNLETMYQLVFGAQALGMAALVRVPDRSGALVQRVLDAGADGILVPQVSSRETAADAVAAMTFSPTGRRGMGATSRAGGWGLTGTPAYVAGGADIVRAVQIEDLDSLRAFEPIVDVEGLSAVFVGYGDLALSSGHGPASEPVRTAVDALLAATRARGLPCGTAVGSAADAHAAAERGFSFVMVSNDTTIFARAAADLGRALRPTL